MDDTKPLWLVKLPQFLYDYAVAKGVANEDVGVVGTLEAVPTPTQGRKSEDFVFRVTAADPALEGKPAVFTVRPRPLGSQQLKAFAEDTAGTSAMVGTVTRKADFIPADVNAYGTMLREKTVKKDEKHLSTAVQKGTNNKLDDMRALYKRRRDHVMEANDLSAAPAQRIDMSRQEMITALLTLFEEHEYWKKTEILMRTNQPDKLVSDALKELTIMHTTGEHKHHYELKPEFKIRGAAPKKAKIEDDL